jgi:hypothetical protein
MRFTAVLIAAALGVSLAGCEPSVRVKVDPINVYAKLDVNVKLQLDREVQSLIQQNPNLF